MGFTVEDWYFDICPANIKNVESLAISQEEKPQTHSGKVCEVQHISDFSQ